MSIKKDLTKRPPRPRVHRHNIPEELRVLDRWVVWKWTLRGDKWQKPPMQPQGGMAQSNNEETWVSFDKAMKAYESEAFDGIGIILPENIVGIDLDNARNPLDGSYTEDAKMYLAMTGCYTEVSPSGEGLKSICYGHLDNKLRSVSHERGVEMYAGGTTNRYFTITGDVVDTRHSLITGERIALHALQCMISDPIEEVFRTEDADITSSVTEAQEFINHLKPHRCEEYNEWLKVGMALHSVSEDPALLDMWDKWSSQSSSYAGSEACEEKWNSFHRNRAGRVVTIGTLRRMAVEDGYRPHQYTTRSLQLGALLDKQIERNYIIEDMLVEGEPMIIGGASKTLKTTVTLDMVLSIATGTPFLGAFAVEQPRRVMLISGESGEATIQENFSVLVKERFPFGLPLEEQNLHISFTLPKLDDAAQVDDLIRDLREKAIRIVVIDPLYRALRCGDNAGNVYAMGEQLDLISTKLIANGITVILLHHFKKQGKTYEDEPQLEDLSQSGVSEFGRQFLLLKRRRQYMMDGKHDIWFSWGGSAGHQGLRVLIADTGLRKDDNIQWKAALHDPHALEAAEAKIKEDRERLELERQNRELLALIPSDKPRSKKSISEDSGITMATLTKRLKTLVASGLVELCGNKDAEVVLTGRGSDRLNGPLFNSHNVQAPTPEVSPFEIATTGFADAD
jgi:hypothetical protein